MPPNTVIQGRITGLCPMGMTQDGRHLCRNTQQGKRECSHWTSLAGLPQPQGPYRVIESPYSSLEAHIETENARLRSESCGP
jgi:hypothetical protein